MAMDGQNRPGRPLAQRVLPAVALIMLLALWFLFDLNRYLSFETLRENREMLLAWQSANPVIAPLIFMLLYLVVVAFSLPGATVMTVSAGFLFGVVWGTLYSVVGATVGATALFLIAKTSLGDYLLARAGPSIQRFRKGFEENALSYLFILRLIPIFPFFLVNLAPAFLGVKLRIYLIATFFGIMPGGFVYALVGAGLGSVFDRDEAFSAASVLTPEVITALIGMAILALLPVLYKKLKGKAND